MMNSDKIPVTIDSVKQIRIFHLEHLTLQQFLSQHHSNESFSWCNGFLIHYVHFDNDKFGEYVEQGTRAYVSVDVASLPDFQEEIQDKKRSFRQKGTIAVS